jgi:hypothetical protein
MPIFFLSIPKKEISDDIKVKKNQIRKFQRAKIVVNMELKHQREYIHFIT